MLDKNLQMEMLGFFDKYLAFYIDFLKMEQEKYDCVQQKQLDSLDRQVKQEQAYELRSRGLEMEREKLVALSGNPKATFRELIEQFDADGSRERAQAIYDQLNAVLHEFKNVNKSCNDLVELRLHQAEKTRERMKGDVGLQKLYDKRARQVTTQATQFSKKI